MPQQSLSQNSPLFIVGCVRSGTTLVRNLLRRQPQVVCPEETHYFRYGEPFRTGASSHELFNSPTLRKHREMDGITEEEFRGMLERACTRGELLRLHVSHMARERGLEDFRWFDKTPQNIYGIALIRSEFPEARFLHLIRNPLNVVASLKLGKTLKVSDVHGACNYWLEAVNIVHQFRPELDDSLLEMRYEDITEDPPARMREILQFSGLGDRFNLYRKTDAHLERDRYNHILTPEEQRIVRQRCGTVAQGYGYDLSPENSVGGGLPRALRRSAQVVARLYPKPRR